MTLKQSIIDYMTDASARDCKVSFLVLNHWVDWHFNCCSIFKVNYVSAHDNETLFDIVSLKVCSTFSRSAFILLCLILI